VALHYCAVDGDVASTRLLLDSRADPDIRDANLRTPLHLAMRADHEGVVQELLDRRADVNAQLDGWTPLMQAAHTGNAGLARRLISARANPDAVGRCQATAVQLAEQSRSLQVLSLLREFGCQVSCRKDNR
jgi:ankyrin repeat protein